MLDSGCPLRFLRFTLAQFAQLTSAIGWAIGNVAAHETGHQLQLHDLDCAESFACARNNYVYEYYAIGTDGAEWSFTQIPGKQLIWQPTNACALEKYFLPGFVCK